MKFEPTYANYKAKIANSFAQQSMMATLGAKLVDVLPGHCSIMAPILTGSLQQHGYAHAALTFAIGDSAAGYAALSLLDEDKDVLTVEMKINLLAPAKGERLIAKGDVIRAGRRLIIVRSEVIAESGGQSETVAILQGTMMPV